MIQKRSILTVALLSVFTCGIYACYWIYVTRMELKSYLQDASINPGLELLFCILCAPYFCYWFYKMSKDIVRAENQAGINPPTDNAVLNLLLSIFGLMLVSMLITQGQLNDIADRQA